MGLAARALTARRAVPARWPWLAARYLPVSLVELPDGLGVLCAVPGGWLARPDGRNDSDGAGLPEVDSVGCEGGGLPGVAAFPLFWPRNGMSAYTNTDTAATTSSISSDAVRRA